MRRPIALVPVLLLGTAVVELGVFVLLARWLGLPWAVLLALATSVLGAVLLRREGVRAWRRFRDAVSSAQPPGVRVADGLVGLVGALLLTVPGFVTGVIGLLLLLPVGRPLARRAVQRVAERRMSSRLAGEVFGPRRVRVRTGRARRGGAGGTAPGPVPGVTTGPGVPPSGPIGSTGGPAAAGPPQPDGPVVEGEIVDPPR